MSTDTSKGGATDAAAGPVVQAQVPIINKRGLHARASAKFVQCAERFNATITVEKDGSTVCGTSIMGLMMLAAAAGTHVTITASGPEAAAALGALKALIEGRFGEDG